MERQIEKEFSGGEPGAKIFLPRLDCGWDEAAGNMVKGNTENSINTIDVSKSFQYPAKAGSKGDMVIHGREHA